MAGPTRNLLKTVLLAVIVTLALAAAAWRRDGIELVSLWADFLGGFHPLVLHVPIGVVVAIVVQALWSRLKGAAEPTGTNRLLWGLAAITATGSFATGYLLVLGGGFEGVHLDRHLWSAVVFTGLCWAGWAVSLWPIHRGVGEALAGGALAAVAVTGHHGGAMVHGDPFAGAPWLNDPMRFAQFGELGEEIAMYEDLVVPIMGAKCVACHGPAKQNGRLRLDTFEGMLAGGENGAVLIPGDAVNSRLVAVIRLPMNHDDHMPPPNRPQIAEPELLALEHWVAAGGTTDIKLARSAVPAPWAELLSPAYRLLEDPAAVAAREAREAEERARQAANRAHLQEVLGGLPEHQRLGFSFIDAVSDRLRFVPATHRHRLTRDDLHAMREVLQACVEIDLAKLPVDRGTLEALAAAPDLERLTLAETEVDGEALRVLARSGTLRQLNLFRTRLQSVPELGDDAFAGLQKLFVGGTEVDVVALQATLPGVEVVGDLKLPPPTEDELVEPEEDY